MVVVMFSMFRCSKLLLTKHMFFMPISEKTHSFSSLTSTNDRSYTVNYLINSCGLSPEGAESASKKVKFKNPERPDSVLELLKKYGFDKTHISVLARRFPVVLTFDSEKTLLPKLEFFKSIGVSDIGRVLSSDPSLLAISLENQMMPAYKFLKSVVGSDKKMVTICDRSSWVVYSRNTVPNITLLRELGVPSSSIELLVNHYTLSIIQNHKLFRVAVDKTKEMGFDPLKSTFVLAVRVLSAKSNKLIWNRCSEEYKRWGWSEDDILSAFKKQPSIMVLSEKKIRKTMGFLVNKFGCQSKSIAKFPSILYFSLEKRIIPRCSVIQALSLKGLIKEVRLISVMVQAEKRFLEKFVTKYEDQLPHLMNIYRGEVDILAL